MKYTNYKYLKVENKMLKKKIVFNLNIWYIEKKIVEMYMNEGDGGKWLIVQYF